MAQGTEEMEDFYTTLLCPDVIMRVENNPINTDNDSHLASVSEDTTSPLDFNITGSKGQFKLTEAEDELRKTIYTTDNPIQKSEIHCTACNCHLGSAVNNLKNVYVHPLLTVIICKKCFDFYFSGSFEKDEDGSEIFCRWCGQGGNVICCSSCPKVFCKMCIKINFNAKKYDEIKDSDVWDCFACDSSQIIALRAQCFEFAKYVREEIPRVASLANKIWFMETDHSQCCSTIQSSKRKTKSKDPDYVPTTTTLESSVQVQNVNDTIKVKQEVSNSKDGSNVASLVHQKENPTTFPQRQSLNNDNNCQSIGDLSVQRISNQPLPIQNTNQWILLPTNANPPRVVQLSVPSLTTGSNSTIQFLVKQGGPPSSNSNQVPAPPLRINPNTQLGQLKKDNKLILTPILNTTKTPQPARFLTSSDGRVHLVERLHPYLHQQGQNNATTTPTITTKPVLQPKNNELFDAKLRLNEKVIRCSSLANGVFGSSIIELQNNFSGGVYAQDFIRIQNKLHESLDKVLVALLQANKDLNGNGANATGCINTSQQQQAQNSSFISNCPMCANNCIRLLPSFSTISDNKNNQVNKAV